jgi:hypothetical protein
MVSRADNNTPSSAGGLIATRLPARLAIFCQSFVGTSPPNGDAYWQPINGRRRQVGAAKRFAGGDDANHQCLGLSRHG